MKNWTIRKRIIVGFTIIVALTTGMGIMAWNSMRVIGEHADELAGDNVPGLAMSADILQSAATMHLALVQHVLAGSQEEKKNLEARIQEIADDNTKLLANLEKVCDAPAERQALEKIKLTRQEYFVARTPILQLSNAGKNQEAQAALAQSGRQIYHDFDSACMELNDLEIKLANTAVTTVEQNASSSKLMLATTVVCQVVISTLLSLLIITGLGRVLKTVSAALNDGSTQVSAAAGQVSAASQTLAEGSSEQASSLEETSSSLEEMASMTKRNAENARKANDLAKEARDSADKGVGDMQTMSAAMDAIKVSSDDIAKIIKTIDEIAFQTNILALNAAVEAARAGEAGMGFAVVADEVRNLAQRCAQAAKETSGKIEGAIAKTGQGVEISDKVAAVLQEIVAKVRQVDELVSEVASATHEQTEGITQINAAVGQMDKVTQGNAATAEESAAAAQELNAQAEIMKQSVGELLQLVGGNSESSARTSSAPARRTKTVYGLPPAAKRAAATNGNANGHGHAPAAKAMVAKRRGDIPLDGDFTNF
jgi:methyl-accepting chemotaxis protein